jgi:cytochrome c-type biogenesis protein CcmH/NrfG
LREYEEIIKQDPDFLPAHSNIAHISLDKGDVERAARAWKEMLRLEPNDVITRHNLMLYEM